MSLEAERYLYSGKHGRRSLLDQEKPFSLPLVKLKHFQTVFIILFSLSLWHIASRGVIVFILTNSLPVSETCRQPMLTSRLFPLL